MSESVTKVGVVTAISEEVKPKKDGSGTYKVYNILIDGKRLGLGYKRKLVDDAGVTVGDTVRVTVVKNGDFWNVDSLEKVAPETVAPPTPSSTILAPSVSTGASTPTYTNDSNGVQQQIVRQSCLKIASALVIGFSNSPGRTKPVPMDQQLGKIVAFADHFVQYVETGKLELANVEDARKLTEEGVEVA